MPKCNNCKKPFQEYTIARATLPVINEQPFEVVKLNCPHCGSMQHMFSAAQQGSLYQSASKPQPLTAA